MLAHRVLGPSAGAGVEPGKTELEGRGGGWIGGLGDGDGGMGSGILAHNGWGRGWGVEEVGIYRAGLFRLVGGGGKEREGGPELEVWNGG